VNRRQHILRTNYTYEQSLKYRLNLVKAADFQRLGRVIMSQWDDSVQPRVMISHNRRNSRSLHAHTVMVKCRFVWRLYMKHL